jgi:Tol biopolymer transport system component
MSSVGRELKKINIPKLEGVSFPRISPSEDSIVFVGHDNDRINLFKYRLKEDVTSQITRTAFTNSTVQWINGFDWMPDGNIVYVEGSREIMTGKADFQLWLADSDGNKIKKLFSRSRDMGIADASPDGRKILLTSGRIFDIDKGELDGVLSFVINRSGYNAKWSASGDLLIYSSSGGYGPGGTMYITSADGSYDQILYTGIPKPVDPAISPDGRFIIFGSPIATWDRYDDAGIYRMELSKPIPEFPINLMIITAVALLGTLMTLRIRRIV